MPYQIYQIFLDNFSAKKPVDVSINKAVDVSINKAVDVSYFEYFTAWM